MAVKEETNFQLRLQSYIKSRGGYVSKTHGSMISEPGKSDLNFVYKSIALYWEVKTPQTRYNVSDAQGIHCRAAKKAGAVTAIIYKLSQAKTILDHIDYCMAQEMPVKDIVNEVDALFLKEGLDNGTSY